MLKSTYNTLDEIPEGDRQHYKKVGNRYVLELDGEHPVQAQNTILAQEKKDEVKAANQRAATAEAEVTRLTTAAQNQPTLPSGHVAVPADEAKLLDSVKEIGEGADTKAKVEHVKQKLTEHADLTKENADLKKVRLLQEVATDSEYKLSVFQTLDEKAGGLTYEKRETSVDNKPQQVWHVKDSNKWVPLKEYAETHWADFAPSLTSKTDTGGTKVIEQKKDQGEQRPNLYSRIREESKERQEKKQKESIPLEKRLNLVA